LNLSHEVLEAQRYRAHKPVDGLASGTLLETQIVDAADSVAYDSHDPDDALEVGLLSFDELMGVSMWREAVGRVRTRFAALANYELRRATVHELIDWQVGDLLSATSARLDTCELKNADEVRRTERLALHGKELEQLKSELEQFLHQRVYRHADLLALREQSQYRLRALFDYYAGRPALLPAAFRGRVAQSGPDRAVGDYLAGMTDRFADQEFDRLIIRREASL
jgi:dGTPase